MNRPSCSPAIRALFAAAVLVGAAACASTDTGAGTDTSLADETTDNSAADTSLTDDSLTDDSLTDDTAAADDSATGDPAPEGSGTFPVVIETASGEVTIENRPEAIVSMSPTATEMLFAIDAGDQVTAADSFSTYPPEAPTTGLSAFEPSLEAVAAEAPDLVVLGFGNPDLEAGLAGLGIPVLLLPAAITLDDTYDQIAQLGLATGRVDEAAAVNAGIRDEISQILTTLPPAGGGPIRVYHELDETFFSASSGSYIGQLYQLLGFENIADAADPDGSIQYPQLQAEQILQADPSLIVITDAYGYGPEEIAARPGWDALTAVSTGRIVLVDDDIASRWGPRVVDFLRLLADAAAPVAANE